MARLVVASGAECVAACPTLLDGTFDYLIWAESQELLAAHLNDRPIIEGCSRRNVLER